MPSIIFLFRYILILTPATPAYPKGTPMSAMSYLVVFTLDPSDVTAYVGVIVHTSLIQTFPDSFQEIDGGFELWMHHLIYGEVDNTRTRSNDVDQIDVRFVAYLFKREGGMETISSQMARFSVLFEKWSIGDYDI
jgi:hypothetical protein